jgi:subtilisin family serine protease
MNHHRLWNGASSKQADAVWALGYRGQDVVVGGEDTGYEWTHPALKKKYRGYDEVLDTADHNYNWHDAIHTISPLNSDSLNPCGLNTQAPCDDHSHGTHTSSTMIGEDGENQIGVAPDANGADAAIWNADGIPVHLPGSVSGSFHRRNNEIRSCQSTVSSTTPGLP